MIRRIFSDFSHWKLHMAWQNHKSQQVFSVTTIRMMNRRFNTALWVKLILRHRKLIQMLVFQHCCIGRLPFLVVFVVKGAHTPFTNGGKLIFCLHSKSFCVTYMNVTVERHTSQNPPTCPVRLELPPLFWPLPQNPPGNVKERQIAKWLTTNLTKTYTFKKMFWRFIMFPSVVRALQCKYWKYFHIWHMTFRPKHNRCHL